MVTFPICGEIKRGHAFPGLPDPNEVILPALSSDGPITYFVGRNGSGKSKLAAAIQSSHGTKARMLSADRLLGTMAVLNYGWGVMPEPESFKGVPIGDQSIPERNAMTSRGMGTQSIYALYEKPAVLLKVVAFVRRALGKTIEMRTASGFLDPVVRQGESTFSLLRDEGHGLREAVILLAATYDSDWDLLIVDEPELHLHPSVARLWIAELEAECRNSDRHALVITHEPDLVKPTVAADLDNLWLCQPGSKPVQMSSAVTGAQSNRVTQSLAENPSLVSSLVFSPRPVLVEGVHDVAAFSTAIRRLCTTEIVAQTDFVPCGGSSGVALWFEISSKLGLDIRAIADLDALFDDGGLPRAMDASDCVTKAYADQLHIHPALTVRARHDFYDEMNRDNCPKNARSRAKWLADLTPTRSTGLFSRRDELIKIWRKNGVWLHPQGRLEDLLGIEDKGGEKARTAAEQPGPIDDVINWCKFELDLSGDLRELLSYEAERVAHAVMEQLRLRHDAVFTRPPESIISVDDEIFSLEPTNSGKHRLTVSMPGEFKGYWFEFDRATTATTLILVPPTPEGSHLDEPEIIQLNETAHSPQI